MANRKNMKRYTIGYAIQYFREKYNISQGILCRGLCSVATLSRIECGDRDVDAFLLEALLERMGQTPNKFELVLTEKDYVLYYIRDEIERDFNKKNRQLIIDKLKEYQQNSKGRGGIHLQYIKSMEAKLNELDGGDIEKSIELSMEAIRFTVPEFSTAAMEHGCFSTIELNIISDIANYQYQNDKIIEAKEIIEGVLEYIRKHAYIELTNQVYAKAIVSVCHILLRQELYEEALKMCESGLSYNIRSRKLNYRGDLSLIKARIIEQLIKNNLENRFQESDFLKCYLQAYYVFDFIDEVDKKKEIQEYLSGVYPWVSID